MEPLKNEGAVVVLSGGQDSTTCLAWAARMFKEVHAVTFNYNQRHAAEIECAQKAVRYFGPESLAMKGTRRKGVVSHHILDMALLNQLAPTALTRSDIPVKAAVAGELPNTFIPGRNLLFITFASILAKQLGVNYVITGVCQTDFSGYPDCRDVFIKSLNTTLNLAMATDVQIITPLMWKTKAQTWEMADDLHILEYVRDNTLTCYNGIIGDGCGTCPACELRNAGLREYLNGWQDEQPVVHKSDCAIHNEPAEPNGPCNCKEGK